MSGIVATVDVDLGDKSYDIVIGAGVLSSLDHLAAALPSKKVCVVTDENVAAIYLVSFMKALEAAGLMACPPVIIPAGDKAKNFEQLQLIVSKSLSYKLDRKSTLLALGGGVVGDITGFAASMVMRGIDFVQVPTTLLAQVDSSVGGKTAINTPAGKNLVGSFYQPKMVLIDTDTLKTLPLREVQAGYAEILKYALIDDPEFFEWLNDNGAALLAGDETALSYAIERSCAAKARVVAADEKEEKGVRALLNLGHTFGHALEALGAYDGRLLHGEAVSIGMKMAFDFSVAQGLCPAEDAARVTAHLESMKMMTASPFAVTAEDVLDKMRGDKKNAEGRMTLILARGIGQAFVQETVDESILIEFLKRVL